MAKISDIKLAPSANTRVLSVLGFSFMFAYLLAFLFEGQVLHGLLDFYQTESPPIY